MTDDLFARGKAALDASTCTDEMMDFFRVGLVRELVEGLDARESDLWDLIDHWRETGDAIGAADELGDLILRWEDEGR